MPQVMYDPVPAYAIERVTSKSFTTMMHYHHVFELFYLQKGTREYFIGDEFYQINEGDVVLIPPNVIHRTAGKVATRTLVNFSHAFLKSYFTEELLTVLPLDRPMIFRPDEKLYGWVEEAFSLMQNRFADGEEASRPFVACTLAGLLFSMAHETNRYVATPYTDQRIGQIVRYINEHFNEIEDIQQIAEHFFISKYHLCRTFNKALGLPLISYLNSIKIRSAAELMKNEDLNLTDIATHCGFNSSSYFCKVFKAEKGVSPTAYRKRLLSK